jgi:hypothetical protein
VATGCAAHYQAWLLNLLAFAIGLLINPRGVHRAFMRGRRSRNLYRTIFSDELLALKVGDVRRELGLDETPAPPASADRWAFIFWSLASATTLAGTWAALLLPAASLVLLVVLLANNKCLSFWSF